MRRTYAYNSITFGFLIGLLVFASTKSTGLGIAAGFGVSVVGFYLIRMFENAVNRGVDKAADKISASYHRRQEEKAAERGTYGKPATTQMPERQTTQFPQKSSDAAVKTCRYCGAEIKKEAKFCPACGAASEN